MKKVIYSITKLGKVENTKITGIGYITDEDLITANVSKTGKPCIRIFPCVKNCHPVMNSTDEFKGAYYEIVEYNRQEINTLLYDIMNGTGLYSPTELFCDKWDKEDPLAQDIYNQNLLAWFGFEETLRNIGYNFETLQNCI